MSKEIINGCIAVAVRIPIEREDSGIWDPAW